jgi:hypothetical protein
VASPPENPARLRQIVGVNGGYGVSRPCRAASLTRSPEPICRDRTDRPLAGTPLCRRPLGQHGSSTTSGNDGNQPGKTGISPGRPACHS